MELVCGVLCGYHALTVKARSSFLKLRAEVGLATGPDADVS